MTPTTEAMARRVALNSSIAPVKAWELPERPSLPPARGEVPFYGDPEIDDPRDQE